MGYEAATSDIVTGDCDRGPTQAGKKRGAKIQSPAGHRVTKLERAD